MSWALAAAAEAAVFSADPLDPDVDPDVDPDEPVHRCHASFTVAHSVPAAVVVVDGLVVVIVGSVVPGVVVVVPAVVAVVAGNQREWTISSTLGSTQFSRIYQWVGGGGGMRGGREDTYVYEDVRAYLR